MHCAEKRSVSSRSNLSKLHSCTNIRNNTYILRITMVRLYISGRIPGYYLTTGACHFLHCHLKLLVQRFISKAQYTYTVELGYSNIGFCDTLPIASNTQWYELIPYKATVFIPCLVRHSQMHQPRI
jgi:hypothetical protein